MTAAVLRMQSQDFPLGGKIMNTLIGELMLRHLFTNWYQEQSNSKMYISKKEVNIIGAVSNLILWRRKWQPSPILLPGECHGQRSQAGYSPWDHKDLDTTERLIFFFLNLHQHLTLFQGLC